jgi:hypothetical protein
MANETVYPAGSIGEALKRDLEAEEKKRADRLRRESIEYDRKYSDKPTEPTK